MCYSVSRLNLEVHPTLGETVAREAVSPHLYCILPCLQGQCYPLRLQLHSDLGDFSNGVCHVMKITRVESHPLSGSRSKEPRTQKLNSHLTRTQSLKVLPLNPGVGKYIAMHATLTSRDFFLANFIFPVHSPAFFPNLSRVFLS